MSIKRIIAGFMCAVLILTSVIVSPGTAEAAQQEAENTYELKAGAASRVITPRESELPMSQGLARQNLVSVHDDLHVRVIALNDGVKTALIVTWELGDTPAPTDFVDTLAEETGVDRDAIFYCATHSHAVPDAMNLALDHPWMVYAKEQMLAAAEEAIENLEPASVGIGYADSYVNVNRNRTYVLSDGSTTRAQGYNPEGTTDKTLALIRFESEESGEPIAFIVNYAVHGVVMYANGEGTDGGVAVSADLPGYVSSCLEDGFEGSVALWISGAAGDQNPIIGNEYFIPSPTDFEQSGPGGQVQKKLAGSPQTKTMGIGGANIMEFLGSIQYSDALRANNAITDMSSEAEIGYGYADDTIPGYEEGTDFYASLHMLRFGDIALLGSSGELFCQYGLTLKEESPLENTLVVNNAATHDTSDEDYPEYRTYMCTDEDLEIGSGQGVKTVFAKGYLSDSLVKMMNTLLAEEPDTEKTAADYYSAGDALKNQEGDYEGALQQFVLGAAMEVTDESKEAIANCLVQIGECCVRLEKGPNGETEIDLRNYVFDCWKRAGELGNGTGYFDLGLAYIGFEIPGAGSGDCLGMGHTDAEQRQGVAYLEKAKELKNGKALRYIGMCYDAGYGVEQSFEKAYECFSQTGGAELYIAKYKLFGLGGLDQDVEGAIADLKKKAESMQGGNRSETMTARLLLAELLYTGSYSENLNDGTVGRVIVDTLDKDTALEYLGYHQEEYNLSEEEIDAIVAGFEAKDGRTAAEHYSAGDALKNQEGDYEGALQEFVLGSLMEETDESREAIANCLVQIGECCVYLEKGPNGETGIDLRNYVFNCWKRAGELGNGTGYFDLGLAYIGFEIPGAGSGDCLGMGHTAAEQKQGVVYLEKAEELKNGKAHRYIGMCYDAGYGVEQSFETAYKYFSETSGAELYIARYQLFGRGGFEQNAENQEAAIKLLTQKATSMKGGNRGETATARLLLAELYYTGSYSEKLNDGTVGTATVATLDQETALTYLGYHQEEYGLSDDEIESIIAGFASAQDYYSAGDALKNQNGDYEGALEQFVLGAAMEVTDASKEAIANCLVQIGECCVYLEKGPNGETGIALRNYVFDCWKKAGELGNGTGYFDLGLAYIGFEIPGAGSGDCLGIGHTDAEQKQGVAYLEKAEELKNGKAHRYIGMCYDAGYGVEQSFETAYKYFSETGGAELYIARYQLFGRGGFEQNAENQEAAIKLLTQKATSMKGGNRSETATARLLLAELYYTGSYSEKLNDGTVGTATVDTLDQETALTYLGYHQEEYGLSDADIAEIVAGFEAKVTKSAAEYYKAGDTLKNTNGDYADALEQFVLGAAVEQTEENKADIANCLVQIGECCVYLEKGPNGETGIALRNYVFNCWKRAGELGNGTGYFDLGLAYIGFEIPGAGSGDCLGMGHTDAEQKQGVAYLEKAEELKNGKAHRYIGMCYDAGYGVEQSFETAYKYFSETSGAELYIARYQLFGRGGFEQNAENQEAAIKLLTQKATSMKGGNRGETATARLLLAELYYTGSYSEKLNDGTVGTVTVDTLDQETALTYLGYHQEEYGLSDDEIENIIAGFASAQDYYSAGDALKNTNGDYEGALEQFVLGAAMEVTDASKEAIANCLVQIGECCVYLEKGPNGETGISLRNYVFDCWKKAGELGNGTGYFDLGLAYIGFEIPGAGSGDCLGIGHTDAEQKQGVAYLEKAEELKNGKAHRYIGMCYDAGYGVDQSFETAYKYFSETSGAELYIARYQLFGRGGFEQNAENQEAAIKLLTQKATSMKGGNRGETATARLLLAELYYTGSYSEKLNDGTVGTATVATLDQETALTYLGYHQEEYGLSDADIAEIVAGFEAKVTKSAAEYYKAGDTLKNTNGDYAGALEQFVLGAAVEQTEENKADIANCLVQIGECCVYLEKGPNGETGKSLQDYVFGCWNKAGELGNGTGYFDLGLAYVGFEIPGAGSGACLGMQNNAAEQKQGIVYLEKAEELKNGKAHRYIGMCYDAGLGVEQSYATAYQYFSETSGAELYIARYMLLGLGGFEQNAQNQADAIKLLTQKATSMKGGNRGETATARLLLAELYYTGSYSEILYDGTMATATVNALDVETALEYLDYHKDEYSLNDAIINAIIAGFEVKMGNADAADAQLDAAQAQINKLQQQLDAAQANIDKLQQELDNAKKDGAGNAEQLDELKTKLNEALQDAESLKATVAQSIDALQNAQNQVAKIQEELDNAKKEAADNADKANELQTKLDASEQNAASLKNTANELQTKLDASEQNAALLKSTLAENEAALQTARNQITSLTGSLQQLATAKGKKVKIIAAHKKYVVKAGKKVKIKAAAVNGGKITYKSKNTKIAKVNKNGKVTGVKKGTTKIVIQSGNVKLKVAVTVK